MKGQFLVLNASTVTNSSPGDTLLGGSGPNWFLQVGDDLVNNGSGPGSNDILTTI